MALIAYLLLVTAGRAGIENLFVGGSIPPRATKNVNSPLVGLFYWTCLMAFYLVNNLVSHFP